MKKNKTLDIVVAFVVLILLIIGGSYFFINSEGWSKVDAFYFTVMTITTVGYGDLVPSHDVSKVVTAFYSMIGIPIALYALTVIVKSYFESRIQIIEKRIGDVLSHEKEIEKNVEEVIEESKE